MIDRIEKPRHARLRRLRRSSAKRRRAAILIIAMWVLVVLSALVLVYARSMQVEAVASANRLGNVKAAGVERAAEQWVLCQLDGTAGDAVSITAIPGQAIQIGDGYFWLIRPNATDATSFDFGLQDEAGKININTATDNMLVNLPNATQEIADAIVTWRNSNGTITGVAGGTGYYEGLQEPYDNKNNLFETVEELMLIQNTQNTGDKTITKDILFGQDLNHNGVVEPSESGQPANGAGAGAGTSSLSTSLNSAGGYSDARGMFPFVTCYTAEPNTDPNGNPRINVSNVSQGNARTQLQQLLSQSLSESQVNEVMSKVAGTASQQKFKSVIQWCQSTGLTTQQFAPLIPYLTTSSANPVTGLVNINTASLQALLALGLTQSDAQTVIANRTSNSGGIAGAGGTTVGNSGTSSSSNNSPNATPPNTDLTWLFQAIPDSVASIGPYITTRSFQYSADIVAVSGDGRSFRRVRIVVDARNSPPVIVYRKDLTGSGWPLPADVRKSMRQGEAPPVIQTAASGTAAAGLP
jgi:type II secretory pathway component PulK